MSKIKWSFVNSFKKNTKSKLSENFRNCPICDYSKSKNVLSVENILFYSDSDTKSKLFDLNQKICLKCHAIFTNPCYSDLGFETLFYEAGKSYGSMAAHTDEQVTWLKVNGLLEHNSIVLDVGCYDGYFLSKLSDNIKKIGVDIDDQAIKKGQSLYKNKNIKFYKGDFETFEYDDAPPTTITMYHVLEHLPRPVEVLKKLGSISNENTNLIVEVPIIEDGKPDDISGFFSEQHLTHFSKNSLENCLISAGWFIEKEHKVFNYNGFRILAKYKGNYEDEKKIKPGLNDFYNLNNQLSFWYKSIAIIEKKIMGLKDFEKIVIWGGGMHTEKLFSYSSFFYKFKNSGFIIIDSDKSKHNNTWRGIKVYDVETIKNIDWSDTGLLISSYASQNEIYNYILTLNVPQKSIIRFYDTVQRY